MHILLPGLLKTACTLRMDGYCREREGEREESGWHLLSSNAGATNKVKHKNRMCV